MKRLLAILASLLAVSAFGGSGRVTAHLRVVSTHGTHTNLTFTCSITLDNQTGVTLIATNLFWVAPGPALRVTDPDGHALATIYAVPWKIWNPGMQFACYIHPGDNTFTNLWYGLDTIRHNVGVSIPGSTKTVRLQVVGTLSDSTYTNRVASNVVEVTIP
jgi:hypothetical protein